MKKLYYLKTCDTCKRIIQELNLPEEAIFQDIKSETISVSQLDEMYQLSSSYEALFSKRAKLYKARDLKNKTLSEEDYKDLNFRTLHFLKTSCVNLRE